MIQENLPANDGSRHNILSLNTYIDYKKLFSLLTDKQKASFHLVCMEGYTYSEAAKILSVPVGTVASRGSHSRYIFNQYFEKRNKEHKK